jgi:hypothetical protein
MQRVNAIFTIAFIVAFVGLIAEWYTSSPLDGYDRASKMTIPDCEIDVVVGHYTKLPHRYVTGPCSGVTLKGCLMGGGTYHRWLRPDVPVPAKDVTPFPGAGPLSTSEQYPNDGFAQGILDDFKAAKAYAQTLLKTCDCGSIKVRIVFAGFGDNFYDNAIKDALAERGVKETEEVIKR